MGNTGGTWWLEEGIRVARTGKKTAHLLCVEHILVGGWSVCAA